jgi:serine/threonine protein kinase
MNTYLQSKYNLQKKLGKGAFGTIYQAYSPATSSLVAIKIEKKANCPQSLSPRQKITEVLHFESKVLKHLKKVEGVPKMHSYWEDENYRFLSMQLLGDTLLKKWGRAKNKSLSMKTIALIGHQIVKILKNVHSKFLIHRDVKPQNLMICPQSQNVYLIISLNGNAVFSGISKKSTF